MLTLPGGDPIKQEGTISVIEPDKTEQVTISAASRSPRRR